MTMNPNQEKQQVATGPVVEPYICKKEAAQRLGWETSPTLEAAIEMAKDKQGRSASVSVIHSPPIAMWDVK